MTRKLLDIAAEIVQAQASVGQMSPNQIELALVTTFSTLQKMQKAEESGVVLESGATLDDSLTGQESARPEPTDSIKDDRILCLECGAEMRQLTAKHLRAHGITPREYKKKWGFSMKQPLSARALTKARSKAAKKRGLPENLLKFLEERRQRLAGATSSEAAES